MSSNLVRYNPQITSLFTDLFDDSFFTPHDILMDKVFGKLFPNTSQELGTSLFVTRAYPKVDIRETDKEYILEAEIPGLNKDQVSVEVKDNSLFIKGEKRNETQKDGKYNVREIKRSSFIRSFALDENIDVDKISAKFENGMLEVTVPKKVKTPIKPEVRKIELK
ncbi:MAG TPA: Hsp20/alpha crystallin family protein [Bacteroidales bacterium]|nr:Hsp20/alpha crystallin family protein [Bacteroidales bacterium]HQI44956.1 Hsp20/alpha crystallin family protein [Bacteroidales bacterium]